MTRRSRTWHRLGAGVLAILSLLALTTVPGSAAPTGTKFYTSSVSTSTPVNAGDEGVVFLVTIRNTSPKQSSSNIGSVSVIVPDEFDIVGSPVIHPSSTNGDNSGAIVTIDSQSPTCQAGTDQQVNACNIAQVKSQKTIVLAITANVTSSDLTCGNNTSGAWVATANTGTALNGDAFTRDPAQTADPTTTIANTCTLAFDPAPVDSAVGTDIPVGVKVLDGTGNPVTTERTVTLSVPGATVTGSPDTTSPFTFSVNGSSTGPYTARASSTGFSDISASFRLFDPASSISGQKWRDHDNDGEQDTNERGLEGWTIGAYQDGNVVGSAITDEDGNYTIGGLASGQSYTVCEIAPPEEAGFEYRGWIQSVPDDAADVCAGIEGAEPNGYTVTFPGGNGSSVTGKDFFNVRTITVPEDDDPQTVEIDCGVLPPGGVFTVGDGINDPIGTVTVDPDTCKPGEYVFETWVSGGEQFAAFYPVSSGTTAQKMPLIEDYDWLIDDDRTQHTLIYDDFVGAGERPMLFCTVDGNGDYGFPPVAEGEDPHTSCLVSTTELATADGVQRHDTVYTEVDGLRKI